jgi:hypothetical protein
MAMVVLSTLGPARSEDGCPITQFPSDIDDKKCVSVSEYDRIRSPDEPMTFAARQISMHLIWISAEGIITKDTPKQFERFLASYDAKLSNLIEFHSPGGNLSAGLALGRMIRKAGYKTRIGRTLSLRGVMNVYRYKQAFCMSACAYAFLGGSERSFGEGELYGLHRFGLKAGEIDGDAAQIVTREIARYLEQMNTDQRVLGMASSTDKNDMLPIPVHVAKELRIIFDPDQAYPFVVEDFKGKVVANSRFFFRNQFFNVRIHCLSLRYPELVVWASQSAFPSAMLGLQKSEVEFSANREKLHGTVSSGSFRNGIAYMSFAIPALAPRHFSGEGLSLQYIQNAALPPAANRIDPNDKGQTDSFFNRVAWADAVLAVSFRIRAENAERTVPIVLRECRD